MRVRPAQDLVDRNVQAHCPDRLWVADITDVPTWSGFLYLAVVLEAFSRRVVGWAMAFDLRAQLVLDAPNMALGPRRLPIVIATSSVRVLRRPFESAPYTSVAFGLRCQEAGVRPSMGAVGDADDNS